jgi:thermostable 8-oxoguanine DNA glycosylase
VQQVIARVNGDLSFLQLPDPAALVMPGVRWGHYEHALTPAFWAANVWMDGSSPSRHYRLGDDLQQEVVACLLGGFGIPAEVGLAAFNRIQLRLRDVGATSPTRADLETILRQPLRVRGRTIRYRFPKQRAAYVAQAISDVDQLDEAALNDVALRDRLTEIAGVGLKTASWVVRNWRGSESVAILDVHLIRACQAMDVFRRAQSPARHYRAMESQFLAFCHGIGFSPALVDAVIWRTMRKLSAPLMRILLDPPIASDDHGAPNG